MRQKEVLEARVAELERQLRDRLAASGEIEDDRPRLRSPEAATFWTAFWRLGQSNGMGGLSIAIPHVYKWADERGIDRLYAEDVLFTMLDDYRSINDELTPKT